MRDTLLQVALFVLVCTLIGVQWRRRQREMDRSMLGMPERRR
jgi:hypothetical protein